MRSYFCMSLVLLLLTPAFGQSAKARIRGPISLSRATALRNSVPAIAARFDIGAASAEAAIPDVRLLLARTPAQEAALDAYIAGELNPASPDYHKWLTPQQFGERVGLDQADITTLVSWLQSRGFTVRPVPAGRTMISFSGSVANLEATFGVHIHQFRRNGRTFLSNVDPVLLPSALAPVVSTVTGLNTIQPHPLLEPGRAFTFDSRKKQVTPELAYGPDKLAVTPGDYATIYNAPNRLNANFSSSSGSGYTGSGVTIGVVGIDAIDQAPVENYRKLFLGESNGVTVVNPQNLSGPGTSQFAVEAFLDVESAGAVAPGANIVYYLNYDPISAFQDALDLNQADIITVSFGGCEAQDGTSFGRLTQQAAAQGITVVVASGDNGSDDCDTGSASSAPATSGLGADGVAGTAYNVAVGGSDFYALTQNYNEYVSASERPDYSSVLGYIPEVPWNNTIASPTPIAQNAPPAKNQGGGVGGGGASMYVAKPSWQTGPGIPNDGMRDTPDVSLFAGNGYDDASTVVCDNEPTSSTANAPIGNCTPNAQGQFVADGRGGTSVAAPTFAGVLALIEQRVGSRLGNAVEDLYALYNSPDRGAVFNDIVNGNNSVPCTEGSPDCAEDETGFYYLTGYDAGPGFDLATGLGSVNITNLVNDWGTPASTSNRLQPSLSFALASSAVDDNQPIAFKVTVAAPAAADPTPTGAVTIAAGGFSSGAIALADGSAIVTIPANTFEAGTVALDLSYSGDSNYNPASLYPTITVVQPAAVTLSVTTPAGVAPGFSATSTLGIESFGGYAGTVTLSCTLTSSPRGAVDAPTCQLIQPTVGLAANESTTETVTFHTTSGDNAANQPLSGPWEETGMGGAALAGVLLFWIPGRRKAWRSMVCVLVALCAVGLMTACSNGGNSPVPNKPAPPSGTTPGTYTFLVKATGNPALTITPEATVTVVVN